MIVIIAAFGIAQRLLLSDRRLGSKCIYEIVYGLIDKVSDTFQVLRFRSLFILKFLFRVFGRERRSQQVTADVGMDDLASMLSLFLQSN